MPEFSNRYEHPSFFRNALAWQGSVTPRVIPRVLGFCAYAYGITWAVERLGWKSLSIGPFEITGAALGLLLVMRSNAGYDRWWEARKLWGGIVNQSRNLALMAAAYGSSKPAWVKELQGWTAVFPHSARKTLRGERRYAELSHLLPPEDTERLERALHPPTEAALSMAKLLRDALADKTLDGFAFMQLERERASLIDHIGACERILRTPIPLVYAIKVRRFILIFLLLAPFALVGKVGPELTPLLMLVVAYPLLSLDQIGVELQNPFHTRNLSHLPLDEICATIEKNVAALTPPSNGSVSEAHSAFASSNRG